MVLRNGPLSEVKLMNAIVILFVFKKLGKNSLSLLSLGTLLPKSLINSYLLLLWVPLGAY